MFQRMLQSSKDLRSRFYCSWSSWLWISLYNMQSSANNLHV